MTCRRATDDPRKCDGCGEFLWVSDDGWFCGMCGVTMPCTMRLLPPPSVATTRSTVRDGPTNQSQI